MGMEATAEETVLIPEDQHLPDEEDRNAEETDENYHEYSTSTVLTEVGVPTVKEKLTPILIGQVASILICLTGVLSEYFVVSTGGISYPSSQNFVSYFLISCVFTTKLALKGTKTTTDTGEEHHENTIKVLKYRGWKYLLIALADVGGNYLVVRAYQYTSLTSVQLLDCFSIPTVLLLSYFVLETRYGHFHYLGVFLCLCGVGSLIAADVESGRVSEATDDINPIGAVQWLGDIICLAGAFLYGVSNVSQEFFVKSFNPTEFLGCLGLMGTLIAGVQTVIFESSALSTWTWNSVGLVAGFGLTQFAFYSIIAYLMAVSSSVAVNLLILSADFYSILVGLFIFQYNFSILYILSFVLVLGGVALYHSRKTGTKDDPPVTVHRRFSTTSINFGQSDVCSTTSSCRSSKKTYGTMNV